MGGSATQGPAYDATLPPPATMGSIGSLLYVLLGLAALVLFGVLAWFALREKK